MDKSPFYYIQFLRWLKITSLFSYSLFVLCYQFPKLASLLGISPYVHFLCKWCLFSWFVVVGVQWGKRLMKSEIEALNRQLETKKDLLDGDREKLQEEKKKFKELKTEFEKSQQEIQQLKYRLSELHQKKLRTPTDSNKLALKRLVGVRQ